MGAGRGMVKQRQTDAEASRALWVPASLGVPGFRHRLTQGKLCLARIALQAQPSSDPIVELRLTRIEFVASVCCSNYRGREAGASFPAFPHHFSVHFIHLDSELALVLHAVMSAEHGILKGDLTDFTSELEERACA